MNSPALIRGASCRCQVQAVHVSLSPHCVQQRVAHHPLLAHQHRRDASIRQLFHAFDFFIQSHGYAPVAHVVGQRFHHFGVRKFQQSRTLLHNRHTHAQRGEHARVLHADHATAHHDQRFRNLCHVQNLIAINDRPSIHRHFRIDRRLRTRRDHCVRRFQFIASVTVFHLHPMRVQKTSYSMQQVHSIAVQLILNYRDFAFDHPLHAVIQVRHGHGFFHSIIGAVKILIIKSGKV